MDFTNHLPPDTVAEIASLLARGFLRYRKSQRQRPVIVATGADNGLDSPAPESRHVTVVNAQENKEN